MTKKSTSKKTGPKKETIKKAAKKSETSSFPFQEGDAAPGFDLPSDQGGRVKLSQLKGKKVVLYFYPKDLTSGCTQESCDFSDEHSAIQKLGAVVLGVSRDSVETHQKFSAKYGFKFPLLADIDGKVCEKFGVWKEKSMYGRKYMGIERTTFIIDEKGRVARIFPKVKVNGHVEEVVQTLKTLNLD